MTAVEGEAAIGRRGVACAHCGLPVPAASSGGEAFCCSGCQAVHAALRECGLDGFYRVRARLDAEPRPARPTGGRFEALDDPAFSGRYVVHEAGGPAAVELYLDHVHCAACVWLVERLPAVLPGVVEARLDLRRRVVRVRWDPGQVSLSAIARQLDRLGYPPHPCRGREDRDRRRAEDRRALLDLAVAGAAAGNAMVIAFALYGGMLHGMEPRYLGLLRWTSMGLCMVSMAWPGRVFFRSAIAALRARAAHVDVPIALGLAAGAAWSVASTIRGAGDVYFESLTALVFLLLVGRWVQQRRIRAGLDAVEMLFCMTPSTARLAGDGREVPLEALAAGTVIETRAGDTLPADGSVVRGRSSIDRALLTGESRPEPVGPGDPVQAGTVNVAAPLLVRVSATGEQTRVGRLMRLVEEAARRPAPIVRLADRVAGWFVVAVLALAVVTVGLWALLDPPRAVPSAMALLIVSCPCALALATPLAVAASIGRAARAGLLIKGGDTVQHLAGPAGIVLLDKTGTLTRGNPAVVEWHGDPRWQPLAAAVEAASGHPVARAIAAAWPAGAVSRIDAARDGVAGIVDGRRVVLGSAARLAREAIELPDWAARAVNAAAVRGATPVVMAVGGAVVAVIGVGDPVRPEAARVVEELRRLGWRVGVLSGDDQRVVDAVAAGLGLEPSPCLGGLSPEGKVAAVQRAVRHGPVVMVGDGANDAAALASASVGVAMRGGAECSLAAADVHVAGDGLDALPELVRGCRRAMTVIRRNMIVSLVYNTAAISLAIAGVMDPLLAALLMPLSSLTVVGLSYRSRTFTR